MTAGVDLKATLQGLAGQYPVSAPGAGTASNPLSTSIVPEGPSLGESRRRIAALAPPSLSRRAGGGVHTRGVVGPQRTVVVHLADLDAVKRQIAAPGVIGWALARRVMKQEEERGTPLL